jgi:hypothetical protein
MGRGSGVCAGDVPTRGHGAAQSSLRRLRKLVCLRLCPPYECDPI